MKWKTTGTLKLVDQRLRLVEVTGPRPAEWRRPKLKLDRYTRDSLLPQTVGILVKTGRTSRFLIDRSLGGDELLLKLAKSPVEAEPYGEGWVIR